MSTHEVRVVRLGAIHPHPNADTLGITEITGYTVVVRLAEWHAGDLGVYIEPDYIVPATEPFAFLGDHRRIKVKKLRGVFSQGLLIRAPEGCSEGEDVVERLGITRYDPPLVPHGANSGEGESGPPGLIAPKYDVEPWRKNKNVLILGENVVITEKIHGANGRYAWANDRLWAGSRTGWRKPDETCLWWIAAKSNPWIEEWCRAHENVILYGEVFGNVQDLKYGGGVQFRGFDARDGKTGRWIAHGLEESQRAPILYSGPYTGEVLDFAEGPSTVPGANHVREGCVIEAFEHMGGIRDMGRVKLKIVGNGYLERA